MITQLIKSQPLVDDKGVMTDRVYEWARGVTQLQILLGTGTPENVIEAPAATLYMDTAAAAGDILYIKRLSNVSGNRKQGWRAV